LSRLARLAKREDECAQHLFMSAAVDCGTQQQKKLVVVIHMACCLMPQNLTIMGISAGGPHLAAPPSFLPSRLNKFSDGLFDAKPTLNG
jgi:hypothetical protein